jgi:predicted exporter
MRPQALAQRLDAARLPGVSWLDLRAESAALLGAYRRQALVSVALGVVLIFGVLAAGLRDAARAVRVLAPVLAGVGFAVGLLAAAGASLTIFHLVGLLLVVGIGVNYALFAEGARGEPAQAARTLRTLLVVSGTTLCAFATLAVSSIPVLHALGATVVTGVVASLVLVGLATLPMKHAA